MDEEQRQRDWWRDLTDFERTQALKVFEELPAWMATSLKRASLAMVEVQVTASTHVCLISTRLRAFLDQQVKR